MTYNASHWVGNEPSRVCEYRAEQNAQMGSAALLKALQGEYLSFALKHRGLTLKDAELMLMNGCGL